MIAIKSYKFLTLIILVETHYLKSGEQCDQIGRNFAIWQLLLEHFEHFYTKEYFINMVCCTYFNIQKQLGVAIFNFQI